METVFLESAEGECYGYNHNGQWFVTMNDRKGGHDEILKYLKENGDQVITLTPIKVQKWVKDRQNPRGDGTGMACPRRGLHPQNGGR